MKKIMSILLTLAMICTFAVVPVSAEITQASDGYYEIATPDDYVAFVTLVNEGNYSANARLTRDIDLSGYTPKPIAKYDSNQDSASDTTSYTGIFDGNGHIIENLNIAISVTTSNLGVGMFGATRGATIKNLGLVGASIVDKSSGKQARIGGIIGYASDDANKKGTTIENCFVKNSTMVQNATDKNIQGIGGIAGFTGANTKVKNTYSRNNVLGFATTSYTASVGMAVGGIGGYSSSSSTADNFENCYAVENEFRCDTKIASIARRGSKTEDTQVIFTNCYTDIITKNSSYDTANVIAGASELTADKLGSTYYKADTNNLNGGYPRLKWETDPAVYSVTAATAENGTVEVDKAEALAGATVTVTVTPAAGYMIGDVKYNDTEITAVDGVYSFTMPAEAVTVSATFVEETKYSVNITAGNGGTVTVDPTSFVPGATVTLNVIPANEGFTAVVTKDGETLDAPYTFTMPERDVAIEATFTAPWDGLGTEADPFIIADASDLQELAVAANAEAHFAGVYFELENDIDCGDVFTVPIANATSDAARDARYFSGIFDGKNYVIKNFTSDKEKRRYVALFGHLKNATVKNLGLENVTAVMSGDALADVATLGALVEDSVITNCYAKDSSLSVIKSEGNPQNAGGLVAEAKDTTFTNCYTQNITMSETGDASFSGCAGGFVGYLKGTSTATNCYSANIKFKNINTSGHVAFFARKDTNAQIANCFRTGTGTYDDESAVLKTATELHSSALLGSAFVADFDKVNGGYPMLAWEVTEAPAYKIILTGVGKDESGVITNVTFETYNGFASGKVYVAVMNGERFVKAVTADMASGTVDIEDITLADGETINVFVWNGVNPLMFAEKGLN